MSETSITDWLVITVAAYAAIVATAALGLEVRRWFESGARLKIDIMPEAKTFNIPGTEGNTYLVATVTNRGNAPTTITHFAVRDYGSWLGRIRSKPTWTVVIPSPQPPGTTSIIPKTLQPGEIWTGMVLYDDKDELKGRIETGQLYVMIYASHADKPILKRVHVPPQPPEDAEEI